MTATYTIATIAEATFMTRSVRSSDVALVCASVPE